MPQSIASIPPNVPVQVAADAQAPSGGKPARSGFTFHDFLNIINPLQHIPVIGTLYRELTGDTMKPISNIVGGALFGGVIGFAGAAIDSIVQEATGEDIGTHIMATLGLHRGGQTGAPTAVASGSKAPAKPVPAFLVAEAAADRAAQASGGGGAPVGTPVGTQRPTDFWRSLQAGGSGVGHTAPPAHPVITIGPPKVLRSAPAADTAQPAQAEQTSSAAPPPASQQPASQPSGPKIATAPITLTPAGPQPLPPQEIPEMMMQALAKYQAMSKAPQAQAVDEIH